MHESSRAVSAHQGKWENIPNNSLLFNYLRTVDPYCLYDDTTPSLFQLPSQVFHIPVKADSNSQAPAKLSYQELSHLHSNNMAKHLGRQLTEQSRLVTLGQFLQSWSETPRRNLE